MCGEPTRFGSKSCVGVYAHADSSGPLPLVDFVWFGTVADSVRSDSVRSGSARLGSVLFGSVRFSSASRLVRKVILDHSFIG